MGIPPINSPPDPFSMDLIAAPHTPMDEAGELRLDVVEAQAEHLGASGVRGVFVAGSTGEGPSLTTAERQALADRWIQTLRGTELRAIVQVGHSSLRESCALARHAHAAGADAIAAAPPPWFPLRSASELVDICAEIASAAPELPFVYYHIPALSGVWVQMSQLLTLGRDMIPTLAGIKYTHSDPHDFTACLQEHGEEVEMFWGTDEKLLTGLKLGASSAVGSSYNFASPVYLKLATAHAAGDNEEAERLQLRAVQLIETLGRYGYAAAAKTVMKFLGVDCGPVRLPLQRLGIGEENGLRLDLEQLGYFEWIREGARSA